MCISMPVYFQCSNDKGGLLNGMYLYRLLIAELSFALVFIAIRGGPVFYFGFTYDSTSRFQLTPEV